MSLRTRLAVFAAALVVAAAAVDAVLQAALSHRALARGRREIAHGVAETLAQTLAFVESSCRDAAPEPAATASRQGAPGSFGLDRLVDELLAGQREGAIGPAGELRELRVLDPQLGTRVGRMCDAAGTRADAPPALPQGDAALARDCIAAGRGVGRPEGTGYRVAAPIRLAEGRSGGAVIVAVGPETTRQTVWWPAAAAGLAAAAVGSVGLLAARRLAGAIMRPVGVATDIVTAVAAGDLTRTPPAAGSPEGARLGAGLAAMNRSLAAAAGRVRRAGARLAAAEAGVAALLDRRGRGSREWRGAVHDVSTAAQGITFKADELLTAAGRVAGLAREASRAAGESRAGLGSMSESMHKLDESVNAFTRKLATISQRAAAVTAVVTTIAKVADQTNLLSVNATIEAEKAGEAGRGFRIVAQEIRRLADQTALATKDIERLVRDMQAAVAGGTMEMDRFRGEASHRIGEVAGVSGALAAILEPVESVTRSLEQVHGGMETLSRGARQVRDGLDGLETEATETAETESGIAAALDEFRAAIAELDAAAEWFRSG